MKRLLAVLLVAGAARAQGPSFPIKTWDLANGLRVVYLGVRRAPVVSVQVWYHVGSKDEPRNLRGAAHLVERAMFKGSKHVPPDAHSQLIARTGGQSDALTSEDATAYIDTVPRQQLDFALQLEADRMRGLVLRQKMVDAEIEAAKEEQQRRLSSTPLIKVIERFRAVAFTRHPYAGHPLVIDADKVAVADLKRFYDTYYVPNNAAVIVVGDATEDEVRAAVEKWFGPLSRAPEPPRPARDAAEPKQEKTRRETGEAAEVGVLFLGYRAPDARSEDNAALRVAEAVLGAGEASRLQQRLVRNDRLAVGAGAQLLTLEDPGLFLVFGAFLAADGGDKLEAAVADEIARLGREPAAEAELTRAKNQLLAAWVFRLEELGALGGEIGRSLTQRGDASAWTSDYDRIAKVTAADVQRVASRYFTAENLTVLLVPPKGGAK